MEEESKLTDNVFLGMESFSFISNNYNAFFLPDHYRRLYVLSFSWTGSREPAVEKDRDSPSRNIWECHQEPRRPPQERTTIPGYDHQRSTTGGICGSKLNLPTGLAVNEK